MISKHKKVFTYYFCIYSFINKAMYMDFYNYKTVQMTL